MWRKRIVSGIRVLLLVVLAANLLIAGSSEAASGTDAASLHLSEEGEISLTSGQKKTLSAGVDPALDAQTKIVWTTSNESIVHISEQGEMTANKKGTATIWAKEIYSGLTGSVTVIVRPKKMEIVRRPYKPSITIKKETDFAGTYLDWEYYNGKEDVSYFIIFCGCKPEKRSKVIYETIKTTKFSYAHKKLKKGKKYHYYVSAFNSEGKKLATSNKVTAKATEPNIGLQREGGYNEIVWKRQDKKYIKGISGYRIYRSNRADGTYKCVKQINSPKKVSGLIRSRRIKPVIIRYVRLRKRAGKRRMAS